MFSQSLWRQWAYLRRLERIVGREGDVEEEDASFVGRPGGAHDRRDPLEEVVVFRSGSAVARRIEGYLSKFLLDSEEKRKGKTRKSILKKK